MIQPQTRLKVADNSGAKEKDLKAELFNLRFQLATGQLSNPQRIGECKKDVARVKTLLCERELKAAE